MRETGHGYGAVAVRRPWGGRRADADPASGPPRRLRAAHGWVVRAAVRNAMAPP